MTNSIDAPERIWARYNGRTSDQFWESYGEWLAHGSQTNASEYVEYIRADLYEALQAENERLTNLAETYRKRIGRQNPG